LKKLNFLDVGIIIAKNLKKKYIIFFCDLFFCYLKKVINSYGKVFLSKAIGFYRMDHSIKATNFFSTVFTNVF